MVLDRIGFGVKMNWLMKVVKWVKNGFGLPLDIDLGECGKIEI